MLEVSWDRDGYILSTGSHYICKDYIKNKSMFLSNLETELKNEEKRIKELLKIKRKEKEESELRLYNKLKQKYEEKN